MQKIRLFLWLDHDAGEAATYYASVVPGARVLSASAQTATFELDGREIVLFNGGPHYALTPATSMLTTCDSQVEIDDLWVKLGSGGEELRCGWLKDRFGLCWQIVPAILLDYLSDDDDERAGRVRDAMLAMVKIDVAAIQRAYDAG